MTPRHILVALLSFFAACLSGGVVAQSWPEKPVRIVVPFPPGGVPDILARIIADKLKTSLSQPILVENRGGAAGNIGIDAVAKSAPDGYTFGVGSSGTHGIHPTLYKNLPFDPVKDFEAVSLLAIVPNVLVVTDKFPARSLAEFIDYARKNPGKINYGSIGNGSSQHLAGTQFESAAGVKMNHIPYKAVPQVVTDLISGQIDCMFQLVPNITRQIKAGQVRAIGVTTSFRSPALPEVPTIQELGVAGYDTAGWFGVVAPRSTPKAIVERFDREIQAALASPDVHKRITEYGVEPKSLGTDKFAEFIKTEVKRWESIVRSSGAQVD